jgi:hypothetical protein
LLKIDFMRDIFSRQSAVGSWQSAVGSQQLAVGSGQSAVGKKMHCLPGTADCGLIELIFFK